MKSKITLRLLFVLLLVMVLAFSGYAQTKPEQVVIALDPDFWTFDPARSYEHYTNIILNACYDNLFKFETGKVEPVNWLVESYEVSPDGKIFTFKLKSGVKFTSGNSFSSEDVKWSFERVKNLNGNPAFLAENIDRVETLDEQTARVYLKETDGAFLFKLASSAFAILDSEEVKSHGGVSGVNAATDDTAEQWLNYNTAGSGPYFLEEFAPDVKAVLKRNDDFWNKPAAVERIILQDIRDSNSQLLMIQKGDIDIAFNLGIDQIKQLRGKSGVEVLSSQTLSMMFLMLNQDPEIGGPISNKLVRNAIKYALDYKGIQEIAGSGAITPFSIFQVGFLGALPPRDPGYTNIEKAKELMVEAGYPNGFKVTFDTISRETEGVSWVIIAQKVQEDLSKIGIDCEIRTSELVIGIDELRRGVSAFRVGGWQPDYVDSNNQLIFLAGQPVGLRTHWKADDVDPDLIRLSEAAFTENDNAKRAALIGGIQGIMAENSPYVPMLQLAKHMAYKEGLKGVAYSNAHRIDVYTLSW